MIDEDDFLRVTTQRLVFADAIEAGLASTSGDAAGPRRLHRLLRRPAPRLR
jgi:hypothetical protein